MSDKYKTQDEKGNMWYYLQSASGRYLRRYRLTPFIYDTQFLNFDNVIYTESKSLYLKSFDRVLAGKKLVANVVLNRNSRQVSKWISKNITMNSNSPLGYHVNSKPEMFIYRKGKLGDFFNLWKLIPLEHGFWFDEAQFKEVEIEDLVKNFDECHWFVQNLLLGMPMEITITQLLDNVSDF